MTEPWGSVVLETGDKRCANCDACVYVAQDGERQCCWCGVTYVVQDGKPVVTGACKLFDGSWPSGGTAV